MTTLLRGSLCVGGRERGAGNSTGGGRTGANGRGEMSVRGTTGGGGLEVVGCPSASRNLRMCSSSVSAAPRRMGGAVDVDLRTSSSESLLAPLILLAARVSN